MYKRQALSGDVYPAVWKSGQLAGKTYGLPWNVSVPVLLYNAGALRKAGVSFQNTWTALETASRTLATGGRRPLIAAADAWTFEANVLSRGGALAEGSRPTLNSPEAILALTQLARMSAAGLAQPRTLDDATRGAFDFARGQNLFVPASVANWNDARRLPFFNPGGRAVSMREVWLHRPAGWRGAERAARHDGCLLYTSPSPRD